VGRPEVAAAQGGAGEGFSHGGGHDASSAVLAALEGLNSAVSTRSSEGPADSDDEMDQARPSRRPRVPASVVGAESIGSKAGVTTSEERPGQPAAEGGRRPRLESHPSALLPPLGQPLGGRQLFGWPSSASLWDTGDKPGSTHLILRVERSEAPASVGGTLVTAFLATPTDWSCRASSAKYERQRQALRLRAQAVAAGESRHELPPGGPSVMMAWLPPKPRASTMSRLSHSSNGTASPRHSAAAAETPRSAAPGAACSGPGGFTAEQHSSGRFFVGLGHQAAAAASQATPVAWLLDARWADRSERLLAVAWLARAVRARRNARPAATDSLESQLDALEAAAAAAAGGACDQTSVRALQLCPAARLLGTVATLGGASGPPGAARPVSSSTAAPARKESAATPTSAGSGASASGLGAPPPTWIASGAFAPASLAYDIPPLARARAALAEGGGARLRTAPPPARLLGSLGCLRAPDGGTGAARAADPLADVASAVALSVWPRCPHGDVSFDPALPVVEAGVFSSDAQTAGEAAARAVLAAASSASPVVLTSRSDDMALDAGASSDGGSVREAPLGSRSLRVMVSPTLPIRPQGTSLPSGAATADGGRGSGAISTGQLSTRGGADPVGGAAFWEELDDAGTGDGSTSCTTESEEPHSGRRSARSTRESDSAAGVPIAHAARRRTRAASSAGVGAPSAPGEPRDQDSPGSSGRDELSPLPGGGRKLVRAGDIATAQPDNAESSGSDSDLTQSRRRRDEPGKFGSAADLPARHGGPTAPAARAAVQAGARPGRLRIGSDGALGVGLAKPPSGAATAKAAARRRKLLGGLAQEESASGHAMRPWAAWDTPPSAGLAAAAGEFTLMAVASTRRAGGMPPLGWSTPRSLACALVQPADLEAADEAAERLARHPAFATQAVAGAASAAAVANLLGHHCSALEWETASDGQFARVLRDELLRRSAFPGASPEAASPLGSADGSPRAGLPSWRAVMLHSALPKRISNPKMRPSGPKTDGGYVDYAGYISEASQKNAQFSTDPLPTDQAVLREGYGRKGAGLPLAAIATVNMQFGRRGDAEFHLAVRAPWSPLQGFAFAVMQLLR